MLNSAGLKDSGCHKKIPDLIRYFFCLKLKTLNNQ
jgi:hypothetical protein